MRSTFLFAAILGAAGGAAQADVLDIWSDDFESYPYPAALDAVYTQIHPADPVKLDQTHGCNDWQSIHFGGITPGYSRRMYRNLGAWTGSDASPLELEVMIDLDDATDYWTRQFIELRDYSEDAYGAGSLDEIVAIGCNSTSVPDTSKYAGRVLYGPTAGWFSYNTPKSDEWIRLTTRIKTSTVEFYVDGVLDTVRSITAGRSFDCIVIGSGLTSRQDVWFDHLKISIVPEPATLLFLAAGGLFLRRTSP